jgi:N-acetylglucosaminyldiphosphoundecaprenol N-acetyl-beta-D-mannosaminyltransferase
VDVGGVGIFDGCLEEAVDHLVGRLRAGHGARVATANLDFLALAQRNAALTRDLNASHLVVADGMPVVWLGKLNRGRRMRRVAGVDLVWALCAQVVEGRPLRVAIYGSTLDTAMVAASSIERRSGARVVAIINPPFRHLDRLERDHYCRELVEAHPDLVLVALGCPRQERVIAEWFPELPSAVWVGVGGTLDFFAGRRRRAPGVAQRLGLEWLVRLAQEPVRLGPRYLGRDVPALARLLVATVRVRLSEGARSGRKVPRVNPPAG